MLTRAFTIVALGLAPLAIAAGQGQTPPTPPTPPVAPIAPVAPIPPIAPWTPIFVPGLDFVPVAPPLIDEESIRAMADQAKAMGDQYKDMASLYQADALRMDDASIRDLTDRANAIADQAKAMTIDVTPFAQFGADFGASISDQMRAGIAPLASFGNGLPNGGPRAAWIQGDPADSVYKAAREALNRGDYRTAARQFETCRTKFAASHYVADCGYWQAFALYRLGSMDDLKTAMQALDAISGRSADLSRQTDVPGLRTRINSALAMRGDATAADQLRKDAQQAGGATCDKEDQSVRVEALSTLGQMDPEAALPTLRSVLSRKDACSVDLRRQAIVLLSRRNDTTAATILSQVAKNDPDVNVRQTAVEYLGRFPGTVSFNTLDDLLKTSTDESLQISVIDALGRSADPRANQSLRSYLDHATSDRLQVAAIRAISGDYSISVNVYNSNFRINDRAPAAWTISTPVAPPGTPAAAAAKAGNGVGSGVGAATPGSMAASAKAATAPSVLVQQMQVAGRGARRGGTATTRPADDNEAFLRTFYPKAKTDVVKEAVISAVASYAGDNTQPFLLAVAANTAESSNVRGFALGRVGMSGAPIASLVKLYDAADSRFMREQLIAVFQARPEPEASDKLFDIIKLGTDPDLQKEAIRALTNKKNDPRATKLLNDLINGRGGI